MRKRHYSGLTYKQVEESRKKYGINVLTPPKKKTFWDDLKRVSCHWIAIAMLALVVASCFFSIVVVENIGTVPAVLFLSYILILIVGLFGGFDDALLKILIVAFVLSMGIAVYEYEWCGDEISAFFEPIGIIVALLLATGVAFFLERINEKTFQSLNEVNDESLVKVIRDDNICQIPRRDVVVGDIVILDTGDEVPADCELLEAFNLTMNESTLTGEPQAEKTTNIKDFNTEDIYPSNHLMKGTTILEGNCIAEVFSVGDKTEAGKVFKAAQVDEGDRTPLSDKLDTLATWITKSSYLMAALIIIGRILTYTLMGNQSFEWLDFTTYMLNTIMIAVTLIVVAVPEGLPMSVTLSLAFSMRKLMKENTLPRTMHACETMGAASVICTDKTGTLTQNKMQVAGTRLAEVKQELLAEMIAVNTTANLDFADKENIKTIGNPTEGALLLWLNTKGVKYRSIRENVEVIDRLPFTTDNKYMATLVVSGVTRKRMLYVKGAPEIILAMSEIPETERKRYEQELVGYQNRAMRTLGLAYREMADEENVFTDEKLNCKDLNFVGLFAIADPIRKDIPQAIRSCMDAGIQVKIVTGDASGTAREVCRQIGLWNEDDSNSHILTGTEMATMKDEELSTRIQGVKILSRAKPEDKQRFIKVLKELGHVVAVTGDGTNDAPALNAADVGLSMGDGTAVAKEASDMTILDNSFHTISNAVMWGRSLYKNIQRFIMFQMTINVVACLIVLIGAFTGTESPLSVTQMLWVNLIMDTFAAVALASLPPSQVVMQEKPRKVTDSIINKEMAWRIFGIGGGFTILLLGILLIMQHGDINSMAGLCAFAFSSYNGLSSYELSLFFTIFVMLQFWNMFNAKAFMTGKSAFADLSRCKGFMLIAAVIFYGQVLIVEFGGKMFNVTPLAFKDWVVIIISTSVVLWIGECSRIGRACRK